MKFSSFFPAALAATGMAVAVSAMPAQAITFTYDFFNITGNNAGDAAIGENQLFVDVTDSGSDVVFTFRNTGPEQSAIANIYFDDNGVPKTLQALEAIINGTGVNFVAGGNPSDIPGGNDPAFNFTADFTTSASAPPPRNGVNPGEQVGFRFSLFQGITFDDVIADLNNGSLRLGMHVIGFASGGSESFINNPGDDPDPDPQPVPEPATAAALGVLALGAFGALKKKKV
jgi:hypothetical protein